MIHERARRAASHTSKKLLRIVHPCSLDSHRTRALTHTLPRRRRRRQAIFKAPPAPPDGTHELIEQYWVEGGDLEREDPEASGRYVVTPGVKTHLSALARAALLRRHPILLQGPTSSGKTSLVEYLAQRTGHRFMRINNHEHTDLQEYLGSYVTDANGESKLCT